MNAPPAARFPQKRRRPLSVTRADHRLPAVCAPPKPLFILHIIGIYIRAYVNILVAITDSDFTKGARIMGIQYDGKSPGKLWYFWQTTKALLQTPFNHTTRKDAGRFGIDAGKTVGVLAAANVALMIPVIAATPILPWVVGGLAITFGFKWGREAWQKFGALKETSFVSSYVRTQETKWYERKKAGNVFTRLKNSVKNAVTGLFAKIPTGVLKAAKWLGIAGAVTGLAGATVGLLGQFAAIPALAPVMTAIVEAGAAIGLTAGVAVGVAIGAAALAIPVGLGVFVASRNAVAARDPEASPFKFKKPAADGTPIEQGKVFEGRSQSFDFNDNSAPPPAPVKTADEGRDHHRAPQGSGRARQEQGPPRQLEKILEIINRGR